MPVTELLAIGVNLMLTGMGIVFTFLVLLVFSMLGMSKLAHIISDPLAEQKAAPSPGVAAADSTRMQGELIAVISAAVSRYRATHN